MGTIQQIKYIELEPETSKPKTSFDEFIYDISKVSDAAVLVPRDIVVVDFDHVGDIWKEILNFFLQEQLKPQEEHIYIIRYLKI